MRQIIIAITMILSFSNAQAQTNYTPTGIWKWTNGSDVIEFFLKRTLPIMVTIMFH